MRRDSEVMQKTQIEWDLYYLRVAHEYASGSKDPSSKVGAIVVLDKRLKSAGYNGFLEGDYDDPRLYMDRKHKLENTRHAELSALDDFRYCNGNATMYIYPYPPCTNCAQEIIKSGRINRVVSTDYINERWSEDCMNAQKLLQDASIDVLKYAINQVL